MFYPNRLLNRASATVLTLVLSQYGLAASADEAPAGAGEAPAGTQSAAQSAAQPEAQSVAQPGTLLKPNEIPPEVAERRAELERLKAMANDRRWEQRRFELNQHYQDLRQRAARSNILMPEAPPWDQAQQAAEQAQAEGGDAGAPRGEGPAVMQGHPATYEAMRERHYQEMRARAEAQGMPPQARPWDRGQQPTEQAQAEGGDAGAPRGDGPAMMQGSSAAYEAMRERHYQEMRARAKAQGIELPELSPWREAQMEPPAAPVEDPMLAKHRQMMEAMSPEQREACMSMHQMQGPGWPSAPAYPAWGQGQPPAPAWGGPRGGWGGAPGWGYPEQDWGFAPERGWDAGPGYGPRPPRRNP